MSDDHETKPKTPAFDFSAFPPDTLFHNRREGRDRRDLPPVETQAPPPEAAAPAPERRAKKERRRRIDPTTFEKQYTDDEMEFMNAMQHFKVQSGKSFPSHGEVLKVAIALGYRQVVSDDQPDIDLTGDALDDESLAVPAGQVELSTLYEAN